jgi:3-oxosteroid 1-dehydrogenase
VGPLKTFDLIVVGSGAAGLTAALAAASRGVRTLVLEQRSLLGGSSAISSGVAWLPNNSLLAKSGVFDSPELARTYLDAIVGSDRTWTSPSRKQAFVDGAPRVLDLLDDHGVRMRYRSDGYPDYYSHRPGGLVGGRSVEPVGVRARALGRWIEQLPPNGYPIVAYATEMPSLKLGFRTWKGRTTLARAVLRTGRSRASGNEIVTMGRSLVGQLLVALESLGVEIWSEAAVVDLSVIDGVVSGVEVARRGTRFRVDARDVILTTGGFAKNEEMRAEYSQAPVVGQWSAAQDGDNGSGITLAHRHGAALAEMHEAWWEPSVILPNGRPAIVVAERFLPHSLMVDGSGQRYMNEAVPYVEAGQRMLRRDKDVSAIPSWLIFDSRYRDRYVFLTHPPRRLPPSWFDKGIVLRRDDLRSLAGAMGVDAELLATTVSRFNAFARNGVDEDFGRGSNAYAYYYGDPTHKPNPCLGTLEKPPFYAVAIYPGDVGTCGGVVTDERARVLTSEGAVLPGLYAAGNAAAPVFGANYPGGGASIGLGMTFGLISGEDVADGQRRGSMAQPSVGKD